jgi:protein disulfide-isomerase A6
MNLRFANCHRLSFAFTALYLSSSQALYQEQDTYIDLFRDTDVSYVRSSSSIWMIQLYDPANPDCQALAKEYEILAKFVDGIHKLGAVDVTTSAGQSVCASLGIRVDIQKVPAVYVIAPSPFDNSKSKPVKVKEVNLPGLLKTLFETQNDVLGKRKKALQIVDDNKPPKKPTSNGKNEQAMLDLDETNFDIHVLQNPAVVAVAFTAPWCGHCIRLKPEWEEAARKLAGEGVILGWVDATANEELASVFGVRGYPTIKVFPGGAPKTPDMAFDYNGEREAQGIVRNLLLEVDRSGVPKEIPELTSQDIMEENCGGHNHICVIAALPHILDSGADGRNKYRDMLAGVSKGFRGSSFSFLWFEAGSQPDLESTLELTFGAPALVAYSMDRQAFAILRGSFGEKSITSFLHSITTGRQRTVQLQKPAPKIVTTEPWDGKDGTPLEDEIPLSEIMGDDEL